MRSYRLLQANGVAACDCTLSDGILKVAVLMLDPPNLKGDHVELVPVLDDRTERIRVRLPINYTRLNYNQELHVEDLNS